MSCFCALKKDVCPLGPSPISFAKSMVPERRSNVTSWMQHVQPQVHTNYKGANSHIPTVRGELVYNPLEL